MNYSQSDYSVRVDVFRPSGKWVNTFTLNMRGMYQEPLHDAVEKACRKFYKSLQSDFDVLLEEGYIFVCLEPYHRHAHPILLRKKS